MLLGVRYVLLFFASARTLIAVQCKIVTTTPNSITPAIGSLVRLQCTTDNPTTIRWHFYATGQMNPLRIHTGTMLNYKLNETFEESFEAGRSILTIKSVRENNTGTYSCFEFETSQYRIDFILQVRDFSTNSWSTTAIESIGQTSQCNTITSHGHTSTGFPVVHESLKPAGMESGVLPMEFASLLVVCLMVIVVFVFVAFMIRNRGNTARGNANENGCNHDGRSSTGGMSQRSSRSKCNTSRHVEDIDDVSYIDATGRVQPESVYSPSSDDGHYSEVPEPDLTNVETSTDVHSDPVGYEGLNPTEVIEISARPPAVYVDLASTGAWVSKCT